MSFSLSEDAAVTLAFERVRSGRRRRPRHCGVYVAVTTNVRLAGRRGINRIVFRGRLARRKYLARGSYRLTTVSARDRVGAKATSRRAGFRLMRR